MQLSRTLSFVAFALLAASLRAQGVGIGEFSTPTTSADEVITLSWEDADGHHVQTVETGLTGTNHKDDDLTKDTTPQKKAELIAGALNTLPNIQASFTGHVVTVKCIKPGGKKGITKFEVKNKTKQPTDKLKTEVSNPATAAYLGEVSLSGGIVGQSGTGGPAVVSVGVAAVQASVVTTDYANLAQVTNALAAQLHAAGVEVSTPEPCVLRVTLAAGQSLNYGCTDLGIDQTAAASWSGELR